MESYENIIGGKKIGEELGTFDVVNPATQEVIATVPDAGVEEAVQAVDAADEAFREWAAKSSHERSNLIYKWFELVEKEKDDLARTMTTEQGKPLKEATGEIAYANGFIKWYAEEGKRIYGETIPSHVQNKRLFVQKQPVGVAALVTPWNFPASMITRKAAPALAAGCTVVIKPAEQTPLTAIKLVRLAEQAGIPEGVLNVVTGDAATLVNAWQEDQRVRKISFTGSTEVGKILMKGAADTMKKISLELGGHAPAIVMDDSDLDKAVEGVIASKFRNAGQTCICTNRVFVQESIAEEFIEKLAKRTKELKVGNGLEEGVDIGPLIDEDGLAKAQRHIDDAKEKGGKVKVGGNSTGGLYFEPTLLTNATEDMLCMVEETFAPILPVSIIKTEEEAIQRANDSVYGLAAYLFTENITRGIRMTEQLEYGIIGLNDGVPSTPQVPFGGFKQSGLGREGGHQGVEEYLEVKYVSLGL